MWRLRIRLGLRAQGVACDSVCRVGRVPPGTGGVITVRGALWSAGCALGPALLALVLAGCVKVAPAPVDLPRAAMQRLQTPFDAGAAADLARTIAPTAPVSTDRLDRLVLFAALVQSDPRIAEGRRAVAVAQADAAVARHASAPTLTLTTEYANDPASSSPWLLGGALDLPLDRGGRRKARLARADLAVLQSRFDLAEVVWTERMDLARAVIAAQVAQAQAPVLQDLLALHDRQLAALDAAVARGERAGLDVLPFRTARAQVARQLDDARGRIVQARAQVAGKLGVPVAALGERPLAWDGFAALAVIASVPVFAAEDRSRAIAARANVLSALAAYDQTEADIALELAKQAPALSIGPGYTWERGLVKLPLALNLALPTFDGNRRAIAAAVARRDKAAATITAALADAGAAIEAAQAECLAGRAALARIRDAELPQATLAAQRADARLQAGAIARVDWTAARITALEAQLAALDALARVRLADAALEDALHRPLDGPETLIDPRLLEKAL